MNNFKCHFTSTATALLIGLTLHSCQYRLRVTGEEGSVTTPGTFPPASKDIIATTPPSRKRSAEALSQDTEEKKESPTDLVRSAASDKSTIVQGTTTVITQDSQESAMMSYSQERGGAVVAEPNGLSATNADKEAADEEDQKESEDLERWFKEFAEAVDDKEVLYKDAISAAIPRLVKEGKQKSYLTKAIKLPINELGWEPDCTPLHYAAAKGNVQAVGALLKESEVVIDAKTEANGSTPLQFAALEGRLETVRLLINTYKDMKKIQEIDAYDDERTSTLQYAALGRQENRNRAVAELLEEAGAAPYQINEDVSLMDIAAVSGNLAMVEYCLEKMYSCESDRSVIKSAIKSAINLARGEENTRIVIMLQIRYESL